jgi:subtilisin-like proprotein convertase family protein
VAGDDNANATEDTALVITVSDLLANDSDGDGDALTATGFTQPANGTLTDNGDGTWTYTPDSAFNGADSFDYTVGDGNGGSDTATVTIDVASVNDNPVAGDDTGYALDQDTSLVITAASLLANDSDVDGDAVSITGTTQPSNGTLTDNGDGSWTYAPDAGYFGPDSFDYTVGDGSGGSDTATVSLTVNQVGGGVIHTYANTTAAAIPNQATITSTIEVSDSFTIMDINVILNITHTANHDLDVYLISPTGTRIELFTDVGGGQDNFVDTELDDSAAVAIVDGSAPFTGVYRAEGDLSAFEGENVNGTWTLEITDDKKRNTGTLENWSLVVEQGSLLVAETVATTAGVSSLSEAQLAVVVAAAIDLLLATDMAHDDDLAMLAGIEFGILDLGGATLGLAGSDLIFIDTDAAGHGWNTDGLAGRTDLLSVVMHEFGHVLGHEHEAEGIMAATLEIDCAELWSDALTLSQLVDGLDSRSQVAVPDGVAADGETGNRLDALVAGELTTIGMDSSAGDGAVSWALTAGLTPRDGAGDGGRVAAGQVEAADGAESRLQGLDLPPELPPDASFVSERNAGEIDWIAILAARSIAHLQQIVY